MAPGQRSGLLDRVPSVGPAAAMASDTTPTAAALVDPLTLGAFLCLMLGMLGKTVFDVHRGVQEVGGGMVARSIPALVVSPIVFLGFIRTASIGVADNGGMLMLFLFAFQNGLFWTGLGRRARRPGSREPQVGWHPARAYLTLRPGPHPLGAVDHPGSR